jgi:hypothetical protein
MDILKLQDTLLKIKSKAEAINDKNGFKSIQNNLETIIERFYGYNNSRMM